MDNTHETGLIVVPYAKKSKRLGFLSLIFAFIYGIPGLIFGILAFNTAKKAEAIYRKNPELYDPSSVKDIMIARLACLMGLIFSGLALFYFTSMLLLQGKFFPF